MQMQSVEGVDESSMRDYIALGVQRAVVAVFLEGSSSALPVLAARTLQDGDATTCGNAAEMVSSS